MVMEMMPRAVCRNCGDPIVRDEHGWCHTLARDGGPCRAQPGGTVERPPQRDLFEVTDDT